MRTSAFIEAPSLLDEYRDDASLLLASPRGALLAGAPARVIPDRGGRADEDRRRLVERVAETLDEPYASDHASLVVGAIPFDRRAPAHLMVPSLVRRESPLRPMEPGERPMGDFDVQAVPSPEEHVRAVTLALDRLRARALDKVVLARSLRLRARHPVEPRAILRGLAARDPGGYTFAVRLPSVPDAGSRILLGASPELLIAKAGDRVIANPMAGSAARGDDQASDRRRSVGLAASAKDRHEHRVVVDHVAGALRPFCRSLDVPTEPELVRTATMWHLSTRVTGRLADPETSSLALALALHPTPAVCGTPTVAAYRAIDAIEPFDRGFYAGVVGWCDARGDGEWVVAIRCAELAGDTMRLFAGGGIVAESDPRAELDETTAKFRTLLLAMGADRDH